MKIWLIDATTYQKELLDNLRVQKNTYFRIKDYVKSNHPKYQHHAKPREKSYSAGLLRIATILRNADYEVTYLHIYDAEKRINTCNSALLPEIIGFSAVTPTVDACASLAKRVKNIKQDTRICLGGPHALHAPRQTETKYPGLFDAIIDKDDLDAVRMLVDNADLAIQEEQDFLDYDLLPFPITNYGINLFTSIGCSFNCAYCQDGLNGQKLLSLDGGLEEIYLQLDRRLPIHFCDCELGGTKQRALEVCEALSRFKHEKLLSCDLRADFIDEELLSALSNAGFVEIRLGLDSADEQVLQHNKRNIIPNNLKEKLELIRGNEADFYTSIYLVTGLPGSSTETFEKNKSLLSELFSKKLIDEAKHHLYVPYPADEQSLSEDITLIDYEWSNYDRQSYPVYQLSNLDKKQIWQQFFETEIIINQLWLDSLRLELHQVPVRSYPEYNRKSYLHADQKRTHILHLSDLHFNTEQTTEADEKAKVKHIEAGSIEGKFRTYLMSLPHKPDFVVITGDFNKAGPIRDQYDSFIALAEEMIQKGKFPGFDRIIVTPGNHDVKRNAPDQQSRFLDFNDSVGSKFIRPWLSESDPSKAKILKIIKSQPTETTYWGGRGNNYAGCIPFVLDFKKNVLIYVFNSAYVSQTQHALSDETLKELEKMKFNVTGKQFQEIEDLINIDPAHISSEEIVLFEKIMSELKGRLENEFEDILKIAVLHHHVTSISILPEIKDFETIINAGQFKDVLNRNGFNVILHGHKHWPEAFVDTAVANGGSQLIVSGGTIASEIAKKNNHSQGFHLITVDSLESDLTVKYVGMTEDNPTKKKIEDITEECFEIPRPSLKQGLKDPVFNLAEIHKETNDKLVFYLRAHNGKTGWQHNLGNPTSPTVDTVGTAYGLRIMKLINSTDLFFLKKRPDIVKGLIDARAKAGGWFQSSSSTRIGRPEITAWVLEALCSWGEMKFVDKAVKDLIKMTTSQTTDPVFFETTFSVSNVLRSLSAFSRYPDEKIKKNVMKMIEQLADLLISSLSQGTNEDGYFWTEKTIMYREYRKLESSIPHTAHCLVSLICAYKATNMLIGYDLVTLRPAVDWLMKRDHQWAHQSEEFIVRMVDSQQEILSVRHYSKPWVVAALLDYGVDVRNPKIIRAVKDIYDDYNRDNDTGLWNLYSSDGSDLISRLPIWATYDSLNALQKFAQRVTIRKG